MQRPPRSQSRHAAAGPPSAREVAARSARLHLRNYDFQWGYAIAVTATDTRTGERFERRYTLQPGEITSDHDGLPAGTYEVVVELDDTRRTSVTATVSERPEETLLIECGNSALSVTQGLG